MAATFEWDEDYGAATGSPTKGTSRTHGVTNVNWKNIGDTGTAYTASPITAGNNSFEKWQSGHFSGSFNNILNGKWAHTAGVLGTGLTLKGVVAPTYTTPSSATNANLTTDMTAVLAIGSGAAVQFGATGPEAAGKAATMATNPCWTEFLTTQLQTTGSAAAGDTATVTLTLQYDEN